MSVIRFADVTIDTDTREVHREGALVEVQPQVFDVLLHLIEHRARVVSKEELLDAVWEHRFVTESALTSRIKSARQVIGDNGRDQRMIRTMHGRGYRFVASLDDEEAPGGARSDDDAGGTRAAVSMRSEPAVGVPVQPTPFIGRESELAALDRILQDPTSRLITIVGPGGIGKTRLAIATAERAATVFEDGVYFVPLAPIMETSRVAHAVVDAIGLVSDARTDPTSQLRAYLGPRCVLLVLDNLEHLQPAELVADLLGAAPGVRVLGTSRERLGLRAEKVFVLGGLGWWSAEGSDHRNGAAVDLFVRAARSARADLELDDVALDAIGRICRLVGGMPLAIELAAGWSDVLSVEGIASELESGLDLLETDLRDVPERHRSIRSVCDASWRRLTPDERDAFMKLSVFRGGFARADAEAVTGCALPTLRRLVATSMVSLVGEDRYAVHELLRQYGEQALADAGQVSDVRQLHSSHYLDRLAERAPALAGGGQLEAVDAIAADLDNIRAAWSDAAAAGRARAIEGAIEALWLFFDTRGNSGAMVPMIDEALRALVPADDVRGDTIVGGARGSVLLAARGIASAERGDLDQGRRLLERSAGRLDAESSGSDPMSRRWAALAHLWLGWVDFLLARNDDAQVHGEVGVAEFEAMGDRWGVARCQYLLGNNDTALGRLESAEPLLASCCATADSIGDVRGASLARRNLSILAGWFGRYGEARALLGEVLATCRAAGDRLGQAYALRELGKIETAEGRAADAVDTLERSISITDDLENRWESAVTEDDLGNALSELGDLESARRSLQRCLEASTANANRYYIARCTGDLGALAARRGDEREAKRLLDRAREMWEEIGHEPYLTWVTVQLGHLAADEPDGAERAARLYATAISAAVRDGLAPFALEIVVGAATLGRPEAPTQRTANLRQVAGHPAATSAVRERAKALLADLDDRPVEPGPWDPGDWRQVAHAAATALETRP